MSKKILFSLCFAGAFALPINAISNEDRSITITKEEQRTIENSPVKAGIFQ